VSLLFPWKIVQLKDIKSEKLKEICIAAKTQSKLDNIPYFLYIADNKEPAYYRYFISSCHYSKSHPFPFESPVCYSEWETTIIDNETSEMLKIALMSNVLIRVKASKRNPKLHFRFSEGHAEVTEIRRAYFIETKYGGHLTIFTYMIPT